MLSNSLFLDKLNQLLGYSQEKCSYLWENSFFLRQLDNLIFVTIIGVFVISTFASSDSMGYVSLITLFLTILKLFVKKGEKLTINTFEVFLLIYFLVVIISLSGSTLLYLSFKGFLKTFTYLGFYFSAMQYYKNNLSKIPFTIFVIALCAASQGIIGIFQNFSQVGEISTWQDVSKINPEDVMTRVYGTLTPLNPNLFGGYMVATLPCLFASFILKLINKKYEQSALFLILAGVATVALILSGCRGAYIGLLFIMASFFSFLGKYIWKDLTVKKELFKKLFLSAIGAIVAAGTCAILFISSIRTRIFSIFAMRNDSSTSFRFNVYHSAIQMAKDNWLLGIGVGNQNFREIYGLYMRTGFDALSSYSVFLELVVESGIFALLAFLGFLVALGHKAIKFILNEKDLKTSVILTTAVISIFAVMVHGFVDTIFFRPQLQFVFWTMVAFVSALTNNVQKNQRN